MTTLNTSAAITPTAGAFVTSPAYSGTFIPTLWSAKLNAKFYAASVFADICNRDWEGEISSLGDKVVINNIPTITISDYTVGGTLSYQVPTPNTIELQIDRAKYYGFQVSDVLDMQSKPALHNMFSDDAAQQIRIAIDSTCVYRTFNGGSSANRGTAAGVKSGGYNLGTDAAPIVLNATQGDANNVLTKILQLASVLDEQNVPDSGRFLVIDPMTRTLLMNTNLAQAQFMGDSTSIVRNGLIGAIDRFKLYVSNQMPYKAASATVWTSGDGTETSVAGAAYAGGKARAIIAGHTSAIAFASQMTKTEQLRNPTDFGDYVRGLQVFGHKVVAAQSLALMVVA